MNTSYIVTLLLALVSAPGLWAVLQFLVSRRDRERKAWFDEAQAAYQRLSEDCDALRKQLRESDERSNKAERRHQEELRGVRRELADVRDALFTRLDAFDEVLPYVQGLSDEKVRELRAANRAVRKAVYRGQ